VETTRLKARGDTHTHTLCPHQIQEELRVKNLVTAEPVTVDSLFDASSIRPAGAAHSAAMAAKDQEGRGCASVCTCGCMREWVCMSVACVCVCVCVVCVCVCARVHMPQVCVRMHMPQVCVHVSAWMGERVSAGARMQACAVAECAGSCSTLHPCI